VSVLLLVLTRWRSPLQPVCASLGFPIVWSAGFGIMCAAGASVSGTAVKIDGFWCSGWTVDEDVGR
jgi:predicted RND superfamily exporter protein